MSAFAQTARGLLRPSTLSFTGSAPSSWRQIACLHQQGPSRSAVVHEQALPQDQSPASSIPHSQPGLADECAPLDDLVSQIPLVQSLRQSHQAYRESRPHLSIPPALRQHHFVGGSLAGTGKLAISPYLWTSSRKLDSGSTTQARASSLVSIFHIGRDLCGHPGFVHGGLLSVMLDEAFARCVSAALPSGLGMTANLNIDFRKPALPDRMYVLRAETVNIEGRKVWVEGRLVSLPQSIPELSEGPTVIPNADFLREDSEGAVMVAEGKALFVEPKFASPELSSALQVLQAFADPQTIRYDFDHSRNLALHILELQLHHPDSSAHSSKYSMNPVIDAMCRLYYEWITRRLYRLLRNSPRLRTDVPYISVPRKAREIFINNLEAMSSQLDPSKPDRHPDLCLEPIWDVVGPMLEFPLSNATWGHLSRIIQARDEFRNANSLDFARELFQRWIELLDDPGFIYPDFEALLFVIEEPTPDNALVFDEVYECQRRFVLTANAVFNLKRQCLDQELANGETICAICYGDVPLGTKVTTTAPVCPHWFHTRCLRKWLLHLEGDIATRDCPICRRVVVDPKTISGPLPAF